MALRRAADMIFSPLSLLPCRFLLPYTPCRYYAAADAAFCCHAAAIDIAAAAAMPALMLAIACLLRC